MLSLATKISKFVYQKEHSSSTTFRRSLSGINHQNFASVVLSLATKIPKFVYLKQYSSSTTMSRPTSIINHDIMVQFTCRPQELIHKNNYQKESSSSWEKIDTFYNLIRICRVIFYVKYINKYLNYTNFY